MAGYISILDELIRDICDGIDTTELSVQPNISDLQTYQVENISATNAMEQNFTIENFCAETGFPANPTSVVAMLQYYLSGVCGLVVCLFGFVGNAMSIMVLSKRSTISSTYVYLIALAVCDSLVLLLTSLINVSDFLRQNMNSKAIRNYKAYTFPYIHPLANTFQCVSIWLTLGFTVDRYIMICHPFQGIKFCNRRRAVTVVVCMYIFGFLYNLPKFFEFHTFELNIDGVKPFKISTLTEFGRSKLFLQLVHFWLYLICVFVLPCLTLAILNTLLIVAVRKSQHTAQIMTLGARSNPYRNDTTLMLVAVVIVFLACQMPALVIHTVWAHDPSLFLVSHPLSERYLMTQEIANFLVILNSAINILLYNMFSKTFRQQFRVTFCRPCTKASELVVTGFRRMSKTLDRRFSVPSTAIDNTCMTEFKSGQRSSFLPQTEAYLKKERSHYKHVTCEHKSNAFPKFKEQTDTLLDKENNNIV